MLKHKPSSKKLGDQINSATLKSSKKLGLFFQDEGRFGRISQLCRAGGPKNKRAIVPAQHIRQYTYAFAAIEPLTGESVTLILPEVNGQTMSLFLTEVSSRYPKDELLMVLDGAAWHKSKELFIPANIPLLFLPPYSPELNPVEQLWKGLRRKWFYNKLFESLEKMEDKLEEALRWTEASLDWVKSFSLYHWIRNAIPN